MLNNSLSNITSHFKPIFYSGSEYPGYDGKHSISKILLSPSSSGSNVVHFHASRPGDNFDLILECTNPNGFTSTGFTILAPLPGFCTAPLRRGLLFISDTKPSISTLTECDDQTDQTNQYVSYSKTYDNCLNEKDFDTLHSKSGEESNFVGFYFRLDDNFQFHKQFEKPIHGKYIHIKFIRSEKLPKFGYNNDNIDVQSIAVYGVLGEKYTGVINTIDEKMTICRDVRIMRSFDDPTIKYYIRQKRKNFIMYSENEKDIKTYEKVIGKIEKVDEYFNFFYAKFPKEVYHHFLFDMFHNVMNYDSIDHIEAGKRIKNGKTLLIFFEGFVDKAMIMMGEISEGNIEKFIQSKKSTEKRNLTKDFVVNEYTGGDDGRHVVQNILNETQHRHTSGPGNNFDLILKYNVPGGCTISNFSILGAQRCTAPIKNGICFISEEKPIFTDYTDDFNDCDSVEKFEKIMVNHPKLKGFYFQTDDVCYLFERSFSESDFAGRYLHLKFISPHKNLFIKDKEVFQTLQSFFGFEEWEVDFENKVLNDNNVDIRLIGIVGYHGKKDSTKYKPFDKIPLDMEISLSPYYELINIADCNYLSKYLIKKESVILLSQNMNYIKSFRRKWEDNKVIKKKFNLFQADYAKKSVEILDKLKIKKVLEEKGVDFDSMESDVVIVYSKDEKDPIIIGKDRDMTGKGYSSLQSQAFEVLERGLKKEKKVWEKIAFVVGMGNYDEKEGYPKLNGPVNDAKEMTKVLEKQFGFEVVECLDEGYEDFKEKYTFFNRRRMKLASYCDHTEKKLLVFFYFSGHGLTIGSSQCLLPVDFKRDYLNVKGKIKGFTRDPSDIRKRILRHCITVKKIVKNFSEQKGKFCIILDACRKEAKFPFQLEVAKKGVWGKVPDYILGLSCDGGKESDDADSVSSSDKKLSPYTKTLIEEMKNVQKYKRKSFLDLLSEVKSHVYKKSGRTMTPQIVDCSDHKNSIAWPPV